MLRNKKVIIGVLSVACVVSLASVGYLRYIRTRGEALEEQCKLALEANEWAKLEEVAYEWAQLEPDKALPWIYAAEGANNQSKPIQTGVYLSMLPDNDERSPRALLELSHLQFWDFNQPIAAEETYKRILDIPVWTKKNEAFRREAHRRLIFYYAMSRQRDRIIEEANRAIEGGFDVPETYIYLIGADWMTFTNGAEMNNRWLMANPGYEPFVVARSYHMVRTSALAQEEDSKSIGLMEKNQALMDRMLEEHPHNLEILAFHVSQATLGGNQKRVAELLSGAPASIANDSRFWRAKGTVHAGRQELKEAEEAYLKALELHPYDWQAQHELAAIYRLKDDFETVKKYQASSMLGKELRRDILQMPSTINIDPDILARMVQFAEASGKQEVADRLRARVAQKTATDA